MKKNIKEIIEENYHNNHRKFHTIINFMRENHQIRDNFNKSWCYRLLDSKVNVKENIRTLFISTINAAGGNNLKRTSISCIKLYEILEKLPNEKILDFNLFIKAFGEKINNIKDFFNSLVSKQFPDFGKKKAALFIRDINTIQTSLEIKLFKNYCVNEMDLFIPLDIVICFMLNLILNIKENEIKRKDFEIINSFAKNILKEEFMLIEDLWFWGFFNTKTIKNNNNKKRIFEFNEGKFYTDIYFYPSKNIKDKLREFENIIKNLNK
jgi:hypothetical protein